MKVGDMVRFKHDAAAKGYDPARGLVVEIDDSPIRGTHRVAVLWGGSGWDQLDGKVGWQKSSEIEVVT